MKSAREKSALEKLLDLPPYSAHDPASEALFMEALGAEIRFHASGNAHYAAFLRRKGFSADGDFALADIPFVHAQVFKIMGSRLATVPDEEIRITLSSSATSGIPSKAPIDQITARRQAKCMAKTIGDFIGMKRRPFLVLDLPPDKGREDNGYGARLAALRGYLSFASSAQYFMRSENGQLIFMEDEFVEAVEKLDKATPVVLFGFTYVLYGALVRPALEKGLRFPLPSGSQILHIGGWKKLEAEKVSREVFSRDLESLFGLSDRDQIDVYGFTEQMGLNYPDCPCGCKHAPHASRLLARHPETHRVLGPGESGALEFISPLPHSYAGCAVLTDDLGLVVPGECPFGRAGTRFRVLGRIRKAEARGCGDIMGEKMRGIGKTAGFTGKGAIRIRAYGGAPQNIPDLARHLRHAASWLEEQPFTAIAGLLAKVASSWMDNPALHDWRHEGLSFLSRWCAKANLEGMANQSLRGMSGALDRFMPEKKRPRHFLRARPVGLVAHWLSGNAPLLGMLVLVQSLLAKNVNILKTASVNFETLETLLGTFAGVEHVDECGNVIKGDALLQCMALVHYPHDYVDAGEALSKVADARIAWGGREAVDAICALPARAGTRDIIFGPKTSFMVIGREALQGEKALASLARRAATDVSVFEQAACSSPHTIFVEEGGDIGAEAFAGLLAEALERSLSLIPKEDEDEATLAAVGAARATGDFLGKCWRGKGWTVLYDDLCELAQPVYSRTVWVRPVANIMDVLPLIHGGIQTIGLALEGERRLAFAEGAARAGALRFPEIGLMTSFDTPWDGMFVLDSLVKWITLGGAASAIMQGGREKA